MQTHEKVQPIHRPVLSNELNDTRLDVDSLTHPPGLVSLNPRTELDVGNVRAVPASAHSAAETILS